MVAESRLAQIRAEERFARDRIATEVRDARSALTAGWEQIERARMNVTLAQELESAEEVRFRRGASDFLALQIREQATFDARLAAVGAHLEYFKAQASYDAVRGLAEMPLPDAHSRDGS